MTLLSNITIAKQGEVLPIETIFWYMSPKSGQT